jgi:LytS/YehU family sensor histidine kinase
MVYLWNPIMEDLQPNFILKILTSFIFSFLVIALYEIVFLSYQISISIKEKEELKRENLASELSGLKEQINPHFLFNSLNTLSALIATEPLRAESFVSKLAKVYRYILDKGSEDIVTLHQEINYLQAYIHLLKERFGESLIVNLDVDESISMNRKTIPLSLQICFENCVKHNIVTNEKPLTVEISVKGQYIYVINNIQPLQLNEPASGVGIQNIKKRYAYFTDLPVIVDSNEKFFSIGLPLL